MKKVVMLTMVLLAILLNGCYFNKQVEEWEVAFRLDNGSSVSEIVGPGKYTSWKYFAKLRIMDTDAKTIEWEDPDLVTGDKQPIGLRVGLTYRRMKDSESALFLYSEYQSEAMSDDALALQVRNRIPRIAKEITAGYKLDELLGVDAESTAGRASITNELFDLLEPELAELKIRLLDVGINDVSASDDYYKLLEDKANAQVSIEVAQERTKELNEQLKQEVSQTAIDIERANRENLVNAELAKTYEQSPEYFELEKLRLYADIFDGDNVWFIDPNANLSLFLTGESIGQAPIMQMQP